MAIPCQQAGPVGVGGKATQRMDPGRNMDGFAPQADVARPVDQGAATGPRGLKTGDDNAAVPCVRVCDWTP